MVPPDGCGVSLASQYRPLPAAPGPALRPLQVSCGVSYRGRPAWRLLDRLPFRMARSDRDTEGAEDRQHLRTDAVDSAVDDADDGDHEATRNIRHGNLLFLGAPGESSWRPCWEQLSSDGETEGAEERGQLGGDAVGGAGEDTKDRGDEAADDGKTHGIPLFLGDDGRAWKASVRKGSGLQAQGKFRSFLARNGASLFSVFGSERVQALSRKKNVPPSPCCGSMTVGATRRQGGCKPRFSLAGSRRIWQTCGRELV
jgi:hypothetical protein